LRVVLSGHLGIRFLGFRVVLFVEYAVVVFVGYAVVVFPGVLVVPSVPAVLNVAERARTARMPG